MEEIWKDVAGYEGLYQVSSYGRVRSIDRIIVARNGVSRFIKGVILNNAPSGMGYIKIMLCNQPMMVHRLVALSFVKNDNPEINTCINHKNENKADNRAENLEWCTLSYNSRYGTATKRAMERRKQNGCSVYVELPIEKYSKDGVFICEYESRKKAAEECGLHGSRTALSFAVKNPNKIVGGFLWKNKGDDRIVQKYENKNLKPVCMVDENGNIIKTYNSIAEASFSTGIARTSICACCKGRKGSVLKTKWIYKDKYKP
jgi:hypothetical protein